MLLCGAVDELRPDFGFHEDDGARADVGKEAFDGGAGVVGQVAVARAVRVFGMEALDLRAAGGRGAGEPQGMRGVGLPEVFADVALQGDGFFHFFGIKPALRAAALCFGVFQVDVAVGLRFQGVRGLSGQRLLSRFVADGEVGGVDAGVGGAAVAGCVCSVAQSLRADAGLLPKVDAGFCRQGFAFVPAVVFKVYEDEAVGAEVVFPLRFRLTAGGDDAAFQGGGAAVADLVAVCAGVEAALPGEQGLAGIGMAVVFGQAGLQVLAALAVALQCRGGVPAAAVAVDAVVLCVCFAAAVAGTAPIW